MNKEHPTYHFIGIGGIGMSALARILLEKDVHVSGSDLSSSKVVEDLKSKGARIHIGHSPEHIPEGATVIYSTDVKQTNPEFAAALQRQYRLLHRSELLALLMQDQTPLVIAGAHGKTTTTALLSYVLKVCGADPSYAVGGLVEGSNGANGKGSYFVAEGDESDGSFLRYHPQGAIVTNVDLEHIDHYGSLEAIQQAFSTFLNQVKNPSLLFLCGDDSFLREKGKHKGILYGFSEGCDLRLTKFQQKGWKILFNVSFEGKDYDSIEIPLVGKHNALNAAAVFGLALRLGIPEADIRKALSCFPGVGRRCQKRGEKHEVLLIDDYAHHPEEIKKTLKGIREAIGERRLVVIFQPHRYTRLHSLFSSFIDCFEQADHLFVTTLYAARENPIPGVSAEHLAAEIRRTKMVPTEFVPQSHLLATMHQFLRPHDVCVTLGAGDITHFPTELLGALEKQPPRKFTVGLFFGGRSCEHEISVKSARFVNASLKRELYDVIHFGIDKQGHWLIGEEATKCLEKGPIVESENAELFLSPSIMQEIEKCDLFFPVLHGTYGEDGTLQGFFEMLGKPYAGPGFRGAAICMDKVLTKRLVAGEGVPTPAYAAFDCWQWRKDPETCLEKAKNLIYPVYVKPSHTGSSVGISKVNNYSELSVAIENAFRFDTFLLIEEGKENCRELEFAVVGNHEGDIVTSCPGEKLAQGAFVDYEKKYGTNNVQSTIEPVLSEELLQKGMAYAKKAYAAVGNSGMTRVDFLLDPAGNYWFFEMNPIPGLQPLSLFPKIWKREGMPGEKLMDWLVILGLERHRSQEKHYNTL